MTGGHNTRVSLSALIKTRLRRMQYRPDLLDGFLAKTGLDLVTPTIDDRYTRSCGPIAESAARHFTSGGRVQTKTGSEVRRRPGSHRTFGPRHAGQQHTLHSGELKGSHA